MIDRKPLSPDQESRISATLQRIRDGLGRFRTTAPTEPAHIYKPEVFDDPQS